MAMTCTVTVTFLDAKRKKLVLKGDKYWVKEGVIAMEARSIDPKTQEIVEVKSTGVPLTLIASYEAIYEKVEDEKGKDGEDDTEGE